MKEGLPRRLNLHLRISFQPNPGIDATGRRRFGVGVYSLKKYVGEHNAITAINRAIRATGKDKITVKLPKYGRIDIYHK